MPATSAYRGLDDLVGEQAGRRYASATRVQLAIQRKEFAAATRIQAVKRGRAERTAGVR